MRAILREVALSLLETGLYRKGETRDLANLTLEGISDGGPPTHLVLGRPLLSNLFVERHYPLLLERAVEGLYSLGKGQVPEYYTFEALKHWAKLGRPLGSGALAYIHFRTNGREVSYDKPLYEYIHNQVNRTQKRPILIAGHVQVIDLGRPIPRLRLYTPFLSRGIYATFSPTLKKAAIQSLDRIAIVSGEAVVDAHTDEIYSIMIQNLYPLKESLPLGDSLIEPPSSFSAEDFQKVSESFGEDLPLNFAEWVRSERNRHIPPSENG